jgi:hypothetical protein
MAEHETVVMVFLTFFVFVFQILLLCPIAKHEVNSSIKSIISILLLTGAISVAEVWFVSLKAAIFVSIFWGVIIVEAIRFNRKIYNIDIEVSKIICVLKVVIVNLTLNYILYLCIVEDWTSFKFC